MLSTRFMVSISWVIVIVLGGSTASAQEYPNKPIRIVTGTVGGGGDFTTRIVAPAISSALGQPLIVDNRAPILGVEAVSKASPDGYTLLVNGMSLWIVPLLQKTAYDPVKDFAPITVIEKTVNVLAVHPSMQINSVKELIALAKAKPGALNYGSASTGSANHLAAELLKSMAGIDIVRVTYKGTAPALTDLLSGQVQLMFATAVSVVQHVKSGKLRALAVTSAEPSPLAPGLPTMAASGLPGYEAIGLTGLFAPAKTPGAIISRLNREVVRVVSQADVKERLLAVGGETVGNSPAEFVAFIKADIAKMSKVIKDAGIKDAGQN